MLLHFWQEIFFWRIIKNKVDNSMPYIDSSFQTRKPRDI